MTANVYFISGIDTGIGKTYAAGYLAKTWNELGVRTITQKLIQTGNIDTSEDIEQHRKIMGCELLAEDLDGLTMPEIFSYPASPHLASKLDARDINFQKIKQATETLSLRYDAVLLEGAGGLMVPLTDDLLTIDYIVKHQYPVILVSSGRLGSINHSLLSLALLKQRRVTLHALAYNHADNHQDEVVAKDTIRYLKNHLFTHFPQTTWIDVPYLGVCRTLLA